MAGLLYPVMPEKMAALRAAIGVPDDRVSPHYANLAAWGKLRPGGQVLDLKSLFPRIDAEKKGTQQKTSAKGAKKREKGRSSPAAENVLIGIEDFAKVELKTATVLEAEPVAGADRLLRLQIDVGGQVRQIVAGIAQFYEPEKIVGKMVVIVANLKPATIRGVESNGMLLAARKGKKLQIITVDGDIPGGASVG